MRMGAVKTSFGPWSAEVRNQSMREADKAIKEGRIDPPYEKKCSICGCSSSETRRMDYHNKNYDEQELIPLCVKCHLSLHNRIKTRLFERATKEELLDVQNALICEMQGEKRKEKET